MLLVSSLFGSPVLLFSILQTATALYNCSSSSYWCDTALGYLNRTDDWWDLTNRPFSPTPFSRDEIGVTFTLYTRSNPMKGTLIYANSSDSIDSSTFNASNPVKVIVHGYTNNGNETSFRNLTASLLTSGDYNVIRTHWPGGSMTNYFHAMVNTRVVGLEIALLANALIANYSVSPASIHLIGHSLGAHICGYAGEKIPKLGKITGLDPAGPFFNGMKAIVRLDPTDAQFVEAVHTDAGISNNWALGANMPLGHLDFYPNGGREQPGCPPLDNPPVNWYNLTAFIVDTAACSHARAIELYSNALVATCPFVAYECPDYSTFQKGGCFSCGKNKSNCALFGAQSHDYPARNRTNVKLYFNTDSSAPYCRYHYRIKASFASSGQVLNGVISSAIEGDKGAIPFTKLKAAPSYGNLFVPGRSQSGLIMSPIDIGKVTSVNIRFFNVANPFMPSSYCWSGCNLRVSSIAVTDMNHYSNEANGFAKIYTACPSSSYANISSGSSGTLSINWCSGFNVPSE